MSILDRINSIKAKPAARYTLMEVVNLIADMVKELYNGGVPSTGSQKQTNDFSSDFNANFD